VSSVLVPETAPYETVTRAPLHRIAIFVDDSNRKRSPRHRYDLHCGDNW
jgi:hypothetical protein